MKRGEREREREELVVNRRKILSLCSVQGHSLKKKWYSLNWPTDYVSVCLIEDSTSKLNGVFLRHPNFDIKSKAR